MWKKLLQKGEVMTAGNDSANKRGDKNYDNSAKYSKTFSIGLKLLES